MKIYDGTADGDGAGTTAWKKRQNGRRSVGVADFAVADDDTTLVTSGLGSCVAVGITDSANAAGLIHVMLPSTDGRAFDNPAKYADSGIAALIEALEEMRVDREQLQAKIAGGSEMIAFSNQEQSIGDRNVAAVRRILSIASIPIVGEDIGGDEGRTVEFDLTGNFVVRTASEGERLL